MDHRLRRFPPFPSLYNTFSTHADNPLLPVALLFRTAFPSQLLRVRCITMFPNNASAAAKRLGKRKMREVGEETAAVAPAFNLQGFHLGSSSSVPVDGRRSQVKKLLNNAAAATPSKKPFSFMALLTADDDEDVGDDYNLCPTFKDNEDQRNQISQMITFHNENLRQSVVEMFEKAEEQATKRLKLQLEEKSERNAELERLAELYKGEAERLLGRVRYLERTVQSLREGLQQANAARQYAETMTMVEEEGESSFEDPDRVGPVRMECKVCERQLATVMVWPCRHVCVCTRCDAATKCCPVCRLVKTTSVEVCLPLD